MQHLIHRTRAAVVQLVFRYERARQPPAQRIKADGGVATVAGLPPGTYEVTLDLPARCRSENGASRRVTVSARRTTAIRFAVTCS